jgi:hypothetical protein
MRISVIGHLVKTKPISQPLAGNAKALHKESSGRISKSETEAFDRSRSEKTKPIFRGQDDVTVCVIKEYGNITHWRRRKNKANLV